MTLKEFFDSLHSCEYLEIDCEDCPEKDSCKAYSLSGYTLEEAFHSGKLTVNKEK